MILADRTIRRLLAEGRIAIDPLEDGFIQPASVDVRLDRTFLAFRRHMTSDIDPWQVSDDLMERVEVEEGKPFILHPGEFVLGTTYERLTLPDDVVARIEGKSSLGRLGLLIHATAGFKINFRKTWILCLNHVVDMSNTLLAGQASLCLGGVA